MPAPQKPASAKGSRVVKGESRCHRRVLWSVMWHLRRVQVLGKSLVQPGFPLDISLKQDTVRLKSGTRGPASVSQRRDAKSSQMVGPLLKLKCT